MTLDVKDYIGPPTQQCEEHRSWHYFVCLQCHAAQHGPGKHQPPAPGAPVAKKPRRKGGV